MRDSDATLILRTSGSMGADPGTDLTATFAERLARPLLIVDPWAPDAVARTTAWLASLPVTVPNVAGPAESITPGIGAQAYSFVTAVLTAPVVHEEENG